MVATLTFACLFVAVVLASYFWRRTRGQESLSIVPVAPDSPESPETQALSPAVELSSIPTIAEAQPDALGESAVLYQAWKVARSQQKEKPSAAIPISALSGSLSGLPAEFVVLDLETTGLDPVLDEIIEVGAIRTNRETGARISFQALVRPARKVPRHITRMTGISQSMVDREGRCLLDVLAEFIVFIQDLPLVTFNAAFDMGFLHRAAKKEGLAINNRYTCALQMARRAWPDLPSHRLVDLARIRDLPNDDNHRALGDCMRALLIFTAAASECGGKIRWTTPSAYVRFQQNEAPVRPSVNRPTGLLKRELGSDASPERRSLDPA